MAGPIRISILANAAKARSEIGSLEKSTRGLGSTLKGVAAGFVGAFALAKVGEGLKSAIAEARESQKVTAQTAAVIKSTGGAANVTAKQVASLSTAISNKVGIDDEAIQSGANMLLTFKNIRNEAGRGNKIFDQAAQTVTDMSVVMKTDASKSAIQLGKALNDPVKGITALQKVGVTFSDKQKATIKSMVDTGNVLGAQKIILKELKSEFGGSAAAQATAGEKAKVAWDNLKETIGTGVLPVLDKVEGLLSSKIIPATSKFVTGMENGTGAGGKFVGQLKSLYSIGQGVVGFLSGLPGPVKKFGVEAAIAAAVLPRLSAAVSGTTAPLRGLVAGLSSAETRAKTLGSAARNAAGVGGLLLLTDASQRTQGSLSTLESIAGGAAAGFGVGGPWGAAAGAVGGALLSIYRSAKQAGGAFKTTAGDAEALRSTLNQTTGQITANTKAWILNSLAKKGVLAQGLKAGLTQGNIVDAYLGKPEAIAKVNAALQVAKGTLKGLQDQQQSVGRTAGAGRSGAAGLGQGYADLKKQADGAKTSVSALSSIAGDTAGLQKQQSAVRLAYATLHGYATLLKQGVPKTVATDIKANVSHSMESVKALTRQYHLTPKQVVTTARIAGFDITLKQARALVTKMAGSGKDASKGINKGLGTAGKTKGNFAPFISSITGATKKGRGIASAGGRGIGSDLKSGALRGIGGLGALLSGQVAAAVHAAIAAGRHAADAHSPSRKTEKLGKDMADGLTKGMKKRQRVVVAQATALATKVTDAIAKLTDLKSQSASYAQGIKSNIAAFGDVTGFLTSDSPFTGDTAAQSIVNSLKSKVAQAKEYAALIVSLTKSGLNKTSIQQLLDAGVSGGLATAQALAAGGKSTITQVNALATQLNNTGASLGASAAKTMYAAGIATAQGLVNGLKAQEPAILAQASHLGKKIAAEVKKALGIKSPSRVFRDIGIQTTKGLQVGLDTPNLRRSGQILASQLVDGFALPQLNANANTGGGNTSVTVRLTAQQLTAMQRGQAVQLDLDAYHGNGGRRAA